MRRLVLPLAFLCLTGTSSTPLLAQDSSARRLTVADGLAHNSINSLFIDSKGYLWVATAEGLSRFDGLTFASYGVDDGLGHDIVNGVAEVPRSGVKHGSDTGQAWV